jgi:hypothetical protein
MPISYEGKDYSFAELEEHIKRTKPGIASPGGYVKTIEEAQHRGKKDINTVNIEHGGETHTIHLNDLAKFHIQRRGFPSILNLGPLSGEGQSGGRYVTEAAHKAENAFVDKLGINKYQTVMDKTVKGFDSLHKAKDGGGRTLGAAQDHTTITKFHAFNTSGQATTIKRNPIMRELVPDYTDAKKNNVDLKNSNAGITPKLNTIEGHGPISNYESGNPRPKGAKTEDNHPFDSMTPYDKYDLLKKLHNNNSVYVTHINPKYKDLSDVSKKLVDTHLGMTSAKQHPFNRLAKERKLELVAKYKGEAYIPYSNDPLYENLDYVAKRGIDNIFNTEKINIISAKLQKLGKELPFNGSPKADTKKTGADIKKESEKTERGDSEQFNYAKEESYKERRLSNAIREAIQSDYKTAGTIPIKNGKPCPQCTGKGADYRNNCPTCEGTGKQMFPYSE